MGALVIELPAESVELALLSRQISCRGTGGFGFQPTMHSFMAAVLLGFTGLDELRQDTEPNPPGRQLGQSSQGVVGKRDTVVAADALG